MPVLRDKEMLPVSGLSDAEVTQRQAEEGYNELPSAKPRSGLVIARDTLREPMLLLLIVAGGVYLALGDLSEALMLLVAVFVVIGITLYQELKTERVLAALKELSSPRALVIRNGSEQRIAGREVVRGDVLVLKEGDRIAADAVLRTATNLKTDESLLTGESLAVMKSSTLAPQKATRPGGENLPFVYSGSLVVQGHGIGEVLATGTRTEVGKIGKALHGLEAEQSPLQIQTRKLVRILAFVGLVLCALVIILYGITRGDWLAGVLAGITLAMSILPEEYPVVLIIFLALGAWRMSRQKVLTRRIPVLETLGEASVLCVDKTGTLTMNRMTAIKLYAGGETQNVDNAPNTSLPKKFHELIELAVLASEINPFDPMEKAFRELGEHYLPDARYKHAEWSLVHQYPLSPQFLAMSHVWKSANQEAELIAAKGAFEAIARLCRLDSEHQLQLQEKVNLISGEGLRVLAIAKANFHGDTRPLSQQAFNFEFIGLVGLADPVRASVPAALKECYSAGVRTIMITGDYPGTAQAIARQIGLQAPELVITGAELQVLSDGELQARTKNVNIFARVLPEQKLRLVSALKANGMIVAMTGDGVNDAPALKAAHIGIAMGSRGTDVAREAASLVLLDDDFASIVQAIKEGRQIYSNLKKAMCYLLAVHMPIAGMSVLPIMFGWPLFFAPIHVVFMEFIIDPACSLVFEAERDDEGLMRQPPRKPEEPLFSRKVLILVLLQGLGALLIVLAVYGVALNSGYTEDAARALAFATMIVANVSLILSNRSASGNLLKTLRLPNPYLWWIVGGAFAALGLALYVPFLQEIFQFQKLGLAELILSLALGASTIIWFELLKWMHRHQPNAAH